MQIPLLDAARHHRAAALNREDVFDRHQERLVDDALRHRNVVVDRLHQLVDRLFPLRFAVQRAQRRDPHHRQIVARELIARQQLAHFQLHQVQQLRIVHHVDLVHGHHDVGHAHLAGQQDVLARLRHGAVGGRHDQNRAIHLRRAGDHVLDVVGVAGAVHVRVVPVGGLVLDVRGRDGDAARLFFRRVVDRIETAELHLRIVLGQHLGDGRRQRRLAVIDVPDRADVHVRLAAIKFFFCHFFSSEIYSTPSRRAAENPTCLSRRLRVSAF